MRPGRPYRRRAIGSSRFVDVARESYEPRHALKTSGRYRRGARHVLRLLVHGNASGVPPEDLPELCLYGELKGIFSSRRLVPSYPTVAEFRKRS